MASRHRVPRYKAKRLAADRRTVADLVWQFTKEMHPTNTVEVQQLLSKFKPTGIKFRAALAYLRKHSYVVNSGAMYALTDKGRAFHDARKGLRDD